MFLNFYGLEDLDGLLDRSLAHVQIVLRNGQVRPPLGGTERPGGVRSVSSGGRRRRLRLFALGARLLLGAFAGGLGGREAVELGGERGDGALPERAGAVAAPTGGAAAHPKTGLARAHPLGGWRAQRHRLQVQAAVAARGAIMLGGLRLHAPQARHHSHILKQQKIDKLVLSLNLQFFIKCKGNAIQFVSIGLTIKLTYHFIVMHFKLEH